MPRSVRGVVPEAVHERSALVHWLMANLLGIVPLLSDDVREPPEVCVFQMRTSFPMPVDIRTSEPPGQHGGATVPDVLDHLLHAVLPVILAEGPCSIFLVSWIS